MLDPPGISLARYDDNVERYSDNVTGYDFATLVGDSVSRRIRARNYRDDRMSDREGKRNKTTMNYPHFIITIC